jgi:aspartate racemase
MKTIGLLGGMSWESTALYYRLINEGIKKRLGGLHSAKIVMVSLDFHEVEALQMQDEWDEAGRYLTDAARRIEMAGADFLVICTNTMHKVAGQVQEGIDIPLLHIADATAEWIRAEGKQRVGLLGTNFTMQEAFYKDRLVDNHGLAVLVPPEEDRDIVHSIIYDELCLGILEDASRSEYLRIINDLHGQGAEGVIEGCTEIVMLVQQQHTDVPLYDTTAIHAEQAVITALT